MTDEEWIDYLWDADGLSYREIAQRDRRAASGVSWMARKHNFTRGGGSQSSRWTRGPCRGCRLVLAVEELDADRKCSTCAGTERRNGRARVKQREVWGVDLEAERKAHRQRMRDRQAQERAEMARRRPIVQRPIPYYSDQ